jgi:hypothetical protein
MTISQTPGMDLIDAFDEAEPVRQLVTGGRYRLPNRDGTHRPHGWMRVTNMVGAYSDMRTLALWQQRIQLLGLRARHDLYEELCAMRIEQLDPRTLKRELEQLSQQAQNAAKADVGSRRGSARHAMVAHWHEAGEVIGTPDMRAQLTEYEQVLNAHWLYPVTGLQERVIIVEALNCAGRLDNIVHSGETGSKHIADLKTQRRFWTVLEVRAQLATYAHADAMWDEERQCYVDMPLVDRELGFAVHMPQEPDENDRPRPVQVLNIDLVKGWRTALRAAEVVADRSEAKRVGTLQACVRPLPQSATRHMAIVEAFARRFAEAATPEEGSALVVQARVAGVWGAELYRAAMQAKARVAGPDA